MKMRIYFGAIIGVLAVALTARAADTLTQSLQHGLFEEEANQNLDAAIKDYQSVISQGEDQRKVIATALFRLGECYRKLGKTNDANAQYQRILRDFSEQEQLVKLSRGHVGATTTNANVLQMPGLTQEETAAVLRMNPMNFQMEAGELAHIKNMIKDSPDLANATGSAVGANNGETLLHKATRSGYYSVAEFLLTNGVNVNAESPNRMTPLHTAALGGRKAMVELLLNHGAEVDRKDQSGYTALHHAVGNGYKSVVEVLLAHKANVNVFNNDGDQPLHIAAKDGFAGVCAVLLDRGAAIGQLSRRSQQTPLHLAAAHEHREVVELLLKRKAEVNARDGSGFTPLRNAANAGRMEIAKILLEAGADPNAQNKNGEFPLLGISNPDMVELLLKYKADPNLKTSSGASALSRLVTSPPVALDTIELLLNNRADPNVRNEGGVPLLFSVVYYSGLNDRLIELLLDHGADPNVLVNGDTPLSIAHKNVVANQSNADYRTASEHVEKLLLDHGANENLQRLSTISYRRPGWTTTTTVFTRGTNDWNRYTLLELFGSVWRSGPNVPLPFPDLAHITIARIDPGTSKTKELQINMDQIMRAGDCSKDIRLEWGDQITVPEQDHPLGVGWNWPELDLRRFLEDCLTRDVQIVVKQETNTVGLLANIMRPSAPVKERREEPRRKAAETKTVYGFRLKEVIYGAQLLRVSSDLTRVHVKRIDPETKQRREWTIDLTKVQGPPNTSGPMGAMPPMPPPVPLPGQASYSSGPSALIPADQDLWLRDGDVIEIPDKQ